MREDDGVDLEAPQKEDRRGLGGFYRGERARFVGWFLACKVEVGRTSRDGDHEFSLGRSAAEEVNE